MLQLASQLEEMKKEQQLRLRQPLDALEKIVAEETARIKNLLEQLSTTAIRLGIEADLEAMILDAKSRRQVAQAELERLQEQRLAADPADFELNYGLELAY